MLSLICGVYCKWAGLNYIAYFSIAEGVIFLALFLNDIFPKIPLVSILFWKWSEYYYLS